MSYGSDTVNFSPDVSRLKKQVAQLIDAARHNEDIHNRFQAIEFSLLSARDFYAITNYLQTEFRQTVGMDFVSLILIDNQNKIKNALCVDGLHTCPQGLILLNSPPDNDVIQNEFLEELGESPRLENYQPITHEWLFNGKIAETGSLALLPLVRREQTIGCLALYSSKPERYQPDDSTEFLQRLGAVTAICVENCFNYEQLRRLSMTDTLTGLANRRELESRLRAEISRSLRECSPISCLYVDVDHFKSVNDKHGHDMGDQVLQNVALTMLGAVRLGDIVSRYGGEEFIIILPGVNGDAAMETAERIRQAVAAEVIKVNGNNQLHITLSAGLASFMPQTDSIGDWGDIAEQLISSADKALMQAKEHGRNRVVVAED